MYVRSVNLCDTVKMKVSYKISNKLRFTLANIFRTILNESKTLCTLLMANNAILQMLATLICSGDNHDSQLSMTVQDSFKVCSNVLHESFVDFLFPHSKPVINAFVLSIVIELFINC